MARSDPSLPLDPNLTAEVVRALHRISEGLAGYTRDLGALSNGYKNLEGSLMALTATVNEINQAMRGAQGPGVLANQAMHRRELDQLEEALDSLKREVVRIDPNAKTRADWFRWTVGLIAVPLIGLTIWFASGWQQTSAAFDRHKQHMEWQTTDLYKHLQEYKARIEQLERRLYRQGSSRQDDPW
jgi:predicted RNase H-like nuclease (RuvC/YqgF family)